MTVDCGASDRLLLRKLVLLAIDDDAWPPIGTGGGRNGSGVEGLDAALELGRRTEVPPTERQAEDAEPESRWSAMEGRVLDAFVFESLVWKIMTGASAETAGSFSLSGETDIAALGASAAHPPDGA